MRRMVRRMVQLDGVYRRDTDTEKVSLGDLKVHLMAEFGWVQESDGAIGPPCGMFIEVTDDLECGPGADSFLPRGIYQMGEVWKVPLGLMADFVAVGKGKTIHDGRLCRIDADGPGWWVMVDWRYVRRWRRP